MSGTSKLSLVVSIRLSNAAYAKIQRALKTSSNSNSSVSDYCKKVIERHAFRHDERKYRGTGVGTGNVHSVSLLKEESRK